MSIDRVRLREQLVYLECADHNIVAVDAHDYQRAAAELRQAVLMELATAPMRAFLHEDLQALQTIAQNVFFESRHRFADLDGSGRANLACDIARALLRRVMRPH